MPPLGMDDYSSLAHRIAGGVADVRGCLILSRDGLILGSFPEDEAVVKPSWLRFAGLGEPERSFVEFAGETWAYMRRGPYAAFAIAGVGVRPGLLLDQLEQVLMAAEEARTRRETLKVPESPAAFSGKPRTSLHPPVGAALEPAAAGADVRPWNRGAKAEGPDRSLVADPAAIAEAPGSAGGTRADEEPELAADAAEAARSGSKDGKGKAQDGAGGKQGTGGHEGPASPEGKKRRKDGEQPGEPVAAAGSPGEGTPSDGGKARPELELEPEAEVDRVLLAKEFSGLLQVEGPDDEAQS